MASLPSLALATSLPKLDLDLRKLDKVTTTTTNHHSHPTHTTFHKPETTDFPRPLDAGEALSVLGEATRADSALYVPILQQCVNARSLPATETLHAHIIKTGTVQDLFLSTALVDAYSKCAATGHARKLFDNMNARNIVTWTALISGYVRNSDPGNAVVVFIRLLESGVFPTNYTLGAVLSACCSMYSIKLGEQVHGYIVKYGIEGDTSVGNSLCSFYTKCGSLDLAVKAFRRIADKNVISWTTIVSACAENGRAEFGLRLFVEMLQGDVEPNEFTLTSALSLCCMVQGLGLGKQVHSMCVKFGCEANVPVKNSIMYLYLKCGELDEARRLFESMETVGVITWNAMIAGHAQVMDLAKDDVVAQQSGEEALQMFLMLNRSGLKPDLFSFSSALTVCSGMVALEQGEQIHAQTIKTGSLADVVVSSALLNMYNKCGCIEKASKAFVEMTTRTLVSWTSMITAYSQHGRSEEAIQLFEDMRLAGVRPNQVTFVGVLSACSHAGMVEEAEHYFKMMTDEYRIKPVMDHYACMVDMYVRLGRLEDAFAFVKRTGFEPNEIIWSILIAGCRSHGNMDLAYFAADKLLELKPKGIETYVLLLNMYISAEKWQDAARVRKQMKEENIGIMRDNSWVNIKDKIHFFKADDRSHPQSSEIYEFLDKLIQKAKSLGYVPYKATELLDQKGEEKAPGFTRHHSERLAVAFGLMNMPEGAPVRVVKNISMCRDCHSSIKFFSTLTRREIIVRDSKRLHKFKDGHCSCGDFGALL